MKIKFNEYPHGTSIELVPETPQEMAQLLRVVKSSKQEKPSMNFYFSGENPTMRIWMKKIKEQAQNNYLTNTNPPLIISKIDPSRIYRKYLSLLK